MITQFLTIILRVITGYYLLFFLMRIFRPSYGTRLYIKETFHLNPNRVRKLRLASQFLFGTIGLIFISYILLSNFAPFGISLSYAMTDNDKSVSELGPKERVEKIIMNGENISVQNNDLVYFTTKMPFHFDTATVTITYQNPYPDQELFIGFKDAAEEWHYDTKIFDSPILNTLSWKKTGNNPTLFQREKKYTLVSDFLKNPPRDDVIGTYDYDISGLSNFKTVIPNYQPQKGNTIIDTPLRGKHVMYTYLKNEPFVMKITKQDLNWYEGEDIAAVKIYKDTDLVYQETISDDGITDTSKASAPAQEVEIKNPGPGYPEAGVYKIVFEAPGDTVIKKIETNLHKIVFEGPLFPVSNKEVYPSVTASTSATTLYTNALALTAQTYHDQARQTILVNDRQLPIRSTQMEEQITTPYNFTKVTIPKNDVVLKGVLGYFSLSDTQFFTPSPYYIIPITTPEDLSLVDYVLTDYSPPGYQNGWLVASRTFDLTKAVVKDEKLSWLIRAPGLQKNGRNVMIKDIQVTLMKRPMITL